MMFDELKIRLRSTYATFPRAFWVLWVGTLVNRLGLVVLPFLTLYLTRQRGLTPAQAALLVSLFGAGNFVAHLVGGTLADRIGRRATILISLYGGSIVLVSMPFIRFIPLLGAFVTLMGFLGEMYRPGVSAAIADVVPPERRARAFALVYWVVNLGAAIAPSIGGFLAAHSFTGLFVLDAATMAGYALFVTFGLSETRPARAEQADSPPRLAILRVLADPALVLLTLSAFLLGMLFLQAFTTLPLAITSDGHTAADYGLAIGLNGLLIVLLSLLVARKAEGRPPALTLATGAIIIGLGFGLQAPAGTLPAYMAAIAVWTIGEMIFIPIAPALVARMAPVELRGSYQGVYGSAWGLASLVGPAFGGFMIDRFGSDMLWLACSGVALFAATGFLFLHRLLPYHKDVRV